MEVRHGSNRGWEAGCRKKCCLAARKRLQSNLYAQARNNGEPPRRISIEKIREKIRFLQEEHHYTQSQIAREIGAPRSLVADWAFKGKFVFTEAGHRLMKLEPSKEPMIEGMTFAIGSSRRVQAMYLRGFGPKKIVALSGVSRCTIEWLVDERKTYVTLDTARALQEAVKSALLLEDPDDGYARKVRKRAVESGWLPLGVWSDIDDPDCVPESVYDSKKTPLENNPDLLEVVLRVRSLAARGFVVKDILTEAEVNQSNGSKMIAGTRGADPETVKQLQRVCDRLEPLPDPEGHLANKTRSISRRKGWK